MAIFKSWRNSVLIEGEKEAALLAREENLPGVNPEFDLYPLDVTLPKRRSFLEAAKKAVKYSSMGIYNMIYKVDK